VVTYKIREVDGDDEHEALTELHAITFENHAKQAKYDEGYWWLAHWSDAPVAFLGAKQSILNDTTGYFYRVGVHPKHRGHWLQLRLMWAMEKKARKIGWTRIVTDTRDNPHSANNIIRAGYKMFTPDKPWGHSDAQYWTKDL
jgi:GNAT superfamily N-acetyltransferase